MKAHMQIDVAIDEIFSNIARYAYPGQEGDVRLQIDFDDESKFFSITFIDKGIPFDPVKQVEPNTALGLEEREIGGLGIFLVKKTMDEMTYRFMDGKMFCA